MTAPAIWFKGRRSAVRFHPRWTDYAATRGGRVVSFKGPKPRVLRPAIDRAGYLRLKLHHDGKMVHIPVHRFVAECWLGPYPDGFETDHLSGNKAQNNVANLDQVPRSENIRRWHARRKGRSKAKTTPAPVSPAAQAGQTAEDNHR